MKVKLKPIPLPPLMIGPGEAQVGDTIHSSMWGRAVVVQAEEKVLYAQPKHPDGRVILWLDGDNQLLSRIGGMPTQSHRLGDLPIGSIVPGEGLKQPGWWFVSGKAKFEPKNIVLTRWGGGCEFTMTEHTRIAVAYEAIELEEPE